MSTERDELRKIIFDSHRLNTQINLKDDRRLKGSQLAWAGYAADALSAAGYRKPRTVTTQVELEALGHGSVIRSEHRHYWVAHKEDGMGSDQGWAVAGGGAITSRELTLWLPATVLFEGHAS